MMIDPIRRRAQVRRRAQANWGWVEEADPANQPVVEGAPTWQHVLEQGAIVVEPSAVERDTVDSHKEWRMQRELSREQARQTTSTQRPKDALRGSGQESKNKKKTSQDSQPDLGSAQGGSEAGTQKVAPGNTRSIAEEKGPEMPQRFPAQKKGKSRWEKGGEFGEQRHTGFPLAEVQEGQDEVVNQGQQEQIEQPFTEEKTMAMKDRDSSQARQQGLKSAQKNVGAAQEQRILADLPQAPSVSEGALKQLLDVQPPFRRRGRARREEEVQDKVVSYGQQPRSERELQRLTPEQQKVEGGLTRFFKSLFRGVGELISVSVTSLFSGILAAALLPFFGPVVAIGVSLGVMAAVTQIQENLKPLGLDLQDDTVRKLAEPLQGKRPDERELRKVIEEVLSEDRPANEDLAKAFSKLLPTINKAAAATNIEFSGPIQGLTIGDQNTVTQTFEGFLHEQL